MHVTCESKQTAAIAEATHTDGVGLSWLLDPQHFTRRLVEALALVLDRLSGAWRHHGGAGRCPVKMTMSRITELPDCTPVLLVNKPGVLAFVFAAGEVTAAGLAAFERAVTAELTHWQQLAA